MEAIIRTRTEAANLGLRSYYTGKPCGRGHDALRYTTTGTCKDCAYLHTKKYVQNLNAAQASIAKGLVTLTIRVPKGRELEIVMSANSMLIEAGHPPSNGIKDVSGSPVAPILPHLPVDEQGKHIVEHTPLTDDQIQALKTRLGYSV